MDNKSPINRIANRIQNLLDLSYLKTYQSSPDNKKILDTTSDRIHQSIDNIMGNVSSNTGFSNVSMLYSRLGDYHNDKDFVKTIEKQLGSESGMQNIDNMMSLYMDNRHVKDIEKEIDLVCKYLPLLEEAVEYKTELILSSDDLKKEFLSFKNDKNNIEEIIANIDIIKEEHKLEDIIYDIVYNMNKYGEDFYAVLPYNKLLEDQLNRKQSISIAENTLFTENSKEILTENTGFESIDITIDFNSYPESFINEAKSVKQKYDSVFDQKDKSDLVPDGTLDGLVQDDKIENKIDINGCYVKRLERSRTRPLYIENTCLGYCYIEVDNDDIFEHYTDNVNDNIMAARKNRLELSSASEINQQETILKNLSSKIVGAIDAKFINNNENLKREIYLLMKHALDKNNTNLKFNVRFFKPEEVFHFYFKKDPKTHRGISDLYRGLLPAKLYSAMLISNIFGILTRGQDKRVYYVKQSIDTNIAQVMTNTLNQIKKSNFGLRDINNLEHILNLTGRFNDYIIPVNGSGDSPINFEIMNGQDIPVQSDLLDMLKNLAVNPTGIPVELLETRRNQVDFAIQVNSATTKVIRHGVNRQSKTQKLLHPFISLIYNLSFDATEKIYVYFPPAFHANMDNTTLMIENTINYCNALAIVEYGDNPTQEEEREIYHFKRINARRILGSMIDPDMLDESKRIAKLLAAKDYKAEE